MKRCLLLFLLLSFAGTVLTSARPVAKLKAPVVYVYICNSKDAVAYHNSTKCHGLQNCTYEVLTVTEEDAINKYGRRQCRICY